MGALVEEAENEPDPIAATIYLSKEVSPYIIQDADKKGLSVGKRVKFARKQAREYRLPVGRSAAAYEVATRLAPLPILFSAPFSYEQPSALAVHELSHPLAGESHGSPPARPRPAQDHRLPA